jgi:hypothetical protein
VTPRRQLDELLAADIPDDDIEARRAMAARAIPLLALLDDPEREVWCALRIGVAVFCVRADVQLARRDGVTTTTEETP